MPEVYTRRINIYIESGQAQAAQSALLAGQDKINKRLDDLKKKQQEAAAAVAEGGKVAQKAYDDVTDKVTKQAQKLEDLRKQQDKAFEAKKKGGAAELKLYDEINDKVIQQQKTVDNLAKKQEKARENILKGNPDAKKKYDDVTAAIVKQEAALKTNTEALDRQNQKISGSLSPSLEDLKSSYKQVELELSRMSKQDAGFDEKVKQFNAAKAAVDKYRFSLVSVKESLKDMLREARGVAVGTLVGNGIQAAVQKVGDFFTGTVSGNAKLSDEFADVSKTTGLDIPEVRELNKELKQIDTRTASSELRQLAVEAGKLGKESVSDVKKFVDEANQIDVALKEDLGENAIIDIAKSAEIYKEGMLNIASGINEVGQSSAASERYQKDFLFRLAGVSQTAKLAAGDVLGYGAALELAGQEVEKSSTALQNFFIDFIKNSDKFGKAAGMAKGELKGLMDTQGVNAAFLVFLKNLKEGSKSSEDLLKKLEQMDIDGARGAGTFLALANSIETVTEQQQIANDAIAKGTSITEEYEKRNHNFAATIDRIKKEWGALTNSTAVLDFLESGANLVLLFFRAMAQLPKVIKENSVAFGLLTAALIIYTVAKVQATLANKESRLAIIADTIATKASELATTAAATAKRAYTLIVSVFTREITLGAAAVRVFNFALAALGGPIGLIVAGLTAAAGALFLYNQHARNAAQSQKKLSDEAQRTVDSLAAEQQEMNETFEILKQGNISTELRKQLIGELNEKYKEYLPNLLSEKSSLIEIEAAQRAANAQLEKKSLLISYGDEIATIGKQLQENRINLVKSERELAAIASRASVENAKIYGSFSNALQKQADLSVLRRNSAANIAQLKTDLETIKSVYKDAFKQIGFDFNEVTNPKGKDKKPGDVTGSDLESDADKKAREKRERQLEDYRAFTEKLNALDRELKGAMQNNDEGEVARLREKYLALERDAEKFYKDGITNYRQFKSDLANIAQLYDEELGLLVDKQFANRSEKELQATQNATQRYYEEQKSALKQQLAQGLIDRENYEAQIDQIDSRSKHVQAANFEDYYATLKLAYKDDAEKLAKLEADKVKLKNDAYNQDYDNAIRAAQRKREAINAQDNADVINAGLSGNAAQLRSARLKQIEDELNQKLELYKDNEAKINEAVAQAAAERAQINSQHLQAVSNQISQYGNFAVNLFQSLNNLQKQFDDIELARDTKVNEKKKKNLQLQLESKTITQRQYNMRVENLEKELDRKQAAIKKEQFERDKAARIAAAVINTAAAVVSAFGTSGNIYAGIALAALAAATGIAQIAIISAEPVPEFEHGTEDWRTGIGGDRHSAKSKGNPILDGDTGKVLGLVEEGEAFIPRENAKANKPLVRALVNSKGRKLNINRPVENIQMFARGFVPAAADTDMRKPRIATNKVSEGDSDSDTAQLEKAIATLSAKVDNLGQIKFVKYNYDRFIEQTEFGYKKTTFDKVA